MKTEQTDKTSISRWKYALIFAWGTMLSRMLGLVRDILIGWFVPDFSRDTFLFAFRLPNTFRDLLGEGAVNASFVPILSECDETHGRDAMKHLVRSLFSIMFLILLAVSLVGVLLMPFVPQLLGSLSTLTQELPKSEEQLQLTVRVLQWTFPYLFWIGIAVFMMAPLFVLGDYKTPGITPALLNIALIVSVFIPYFFAINIIWALVIGLWLGGILQAGMLYFEARKKLGSLGFTTDWKQREVKKAFILLIPVIFGQAAGEVNKLVDSFFSYSLSEGTVSALFYANRLIQLPLAIFGTAVSVSILPELSRYFANKEHQKIREALQEGLLQTLFMILPAMVMLMLLGKPIVQLLFERGHFGEELTQKTANAIFIYSIGVIGFSGVKVLAQGFYAMNNTTIPVITSSFSMILNIILNILLVRPLDYSGLVIATTISFWTNFFILLTLISFKVGNLVNEKYLLDILKYGISIFIVICMFFLVNLLFNKKNVNGVIELSLYICVTGLVCSLTYLVSAWALNIKEMKQILSIINRKFNIKN